MGEQTMGEWKIIEQLEEIRKRQNEIRSLLVEIGGIPPKVELQSEAKDY